MTLPSGGLDSTDSTLLRRFPLVFLITPDYWDGLAYQRHHLARHFVAAGCPVVFVERTPQRWPRHWLGDLRDWVRRKGHGIPGRHKEPPPAGISVVAPRWLPPSKALRPLANLIVRRSVMPYRDQQADCIVITYNPTDSAIALIRCMQPLVSAYICVHNYDADRVPHALLESERTLAQTVDILLADSRFLRERLKGLSGRNRVGLSPPGVNYAAFASAFRGDEHRDPRRICYFGGVGQHLDVDLYARLADEHFSVTCVGVVDPNVRSTISPKIKVLPPVSNSDLPKVLRDADVLMLAYRRSAYTDGVIPAKFFECLATGKPVLVSGLCETHRYAACVYDVRGSVDKAKEILSMLPALETAERRQARFAVASAADWSNRFESLVKSLETAYCARRNR